MKKFYLITTIALITFVSQVIFAQTTIWSEDFDSYTDNSGYIGPGPVTTGDYPSLVSQWVLDVTGGSLTNGNDWFMVNNGLFEARDVDGPCIWTSEEINISGYSEVSFELVASRQGNFESDDYLDVEYRIDAGTWTLIQDWNGQGSATHTLIEDFSSPQTPAVSGLSGSTLDIRVTMRNSSGFEYLRIDDILVYEPLPGDDCANAIVISEVTDYAFSTTGATSSGANPGCGGGTDPVDIWFEYTPATDGTISIDLCGSSYDTRLAVWDACGGNVLGCNDDSENCGNNSYQSYLSGQVTGGTTYYIQVGGYNAATGDGLLTIILANIPTNDDCANAIAIGEVTDLPFNTLAASASGINPACGGTDPVDIWYTYTATETGTVSVDLCGSTYDTRLAVWDACGGNEIACNDDSYSCGYPSYQSYLTTPVTAGNTYYIQVGGYNDATGSGYLTLLFATYPANDDCANATPIGEVSDFPFSTLAATSSGNNPGCGGGTAPVDVWFEYTATETGIGSFDLCGSNFDTRLALWDACGGNLIACNDDDSYCGTSSVQSYLTEPVTAGNTYYIQVGGYESEKGSGDLTVFVIPYPTNDDCASAIAIGDVTDMPFTTIGATASGVNPGCGGIDNPIDIWYAYTPQRSGLAMFDLCGSGFNTRLAIYDACGGTLLDCNSNNGPACTGQQSSIEMQVVEGTTYYVQIGGANQNIGIGDLTIFVEFGGYTWTGASDDEWANPLNWDSGVVPDVTIPVLIPSGALNYPYFFSSLYVGQPYGSNACYSLEIEGGATLTIYGYGHLGVFLNDVIVKSGGSLIVKRLLIGFEADLFIEGGTVVATESCQFLSGGGIMSDGSFYVGGLLESSTQWSQTGGTMYLIPGINTEILWHTPTGYLNNLVVESGQSVVLSGESTQELIINGDFILEPSAQFTLEEPVGAGNVVEVSVGQDLILLGDATGNASLVDNGTLNVTGTTQVENYYTDARWHFISSPVSGAVSNVFLGIYLKDWDESTYTWSYILPVDHPLTPGEGFSIWSTLGNPTSSYTGGVLNTGDQPVTVTATDVGGAAGIDNGEGWNLVGNPFPSAIDLGAPGDVLPGYTWTNLAYSVYFWNSVQYASYNPNTGSAINGGSRYVPSMQSFFVKADDFSPALTIPNSARLHDATPNYKVLEENQSIRMQVKSGNYTDELLIMTHPLATPGYDNEYDAYKIMGIEEAPQFFALVNDNKFSINALGEIEREDVIDLGFIAGESNVYAINATEMVNLEDFEVIMLEDRSANTWTDLTQHPEYQFETKGDEEENRFRLHFRNPLEDLAGSNHGIYIYSYDNDVFIYSQEERNGDVRIYDVIGQQVAGLNNLDEGLNSIQVNNGIGYFVVEYQSGEILVTEKVFIR